jgi:hypothetical protein
MGQKDQGKLSMAVVTVAIQTDAYLLSVFLGVKEMIHILRFEV